MSIGSKIKTLREAKNMTQEELGKILHSTKQTVFKYESGIITNIPMDKIEVLAKVFDVSPAYLMGWNDDPELPLPSNVYAVEEVIYYDEIGSVRAGYDGSCIEEHTGRKIPIPSSMLKGHKQSDFMTLQVNGNSMYPRLLDGDTILVLRTESVDSGDTAVIMYNGDEATVKKVRYVQGEDWLELIPANPEYPTKRIEGSELEQCRVLGKVVKLIRDM